MLVLTLMNLAAAGLVVYFQQIAFAEQDKYALGVRRSLSQQRVQQVAVDIRRVFEGAVIDTLFAAVTEADVDDALVLVARQLEQGHQRYPYVHRFFVWNSATERIALDEVFFFRRPGEPGENSIPIHLEGLGEAGFYRDRDMGTQIAQMSRRYGDAGFQVAYAVLDRTWGGVRYQVVLRWAWVTDQADGRFTLSGFLVDMDGLRNGFFSRLLSSSTLPWAHDRESYGTLYVRDESERVIFGEAPGDGSPIAETPLTMTFFPTDIRASRLVENAKGPVWTLGHLVAMPGSDISLFELAGRHWPSAAAVLLMSTAVGLAFRVHRHSTHLAALQSNVVSMVAHQLKTPLSIVKMAAETLQLGRVSDTGQISQYVTVIRAEAGGLLNLVDQSLELLRTDSERSNALRERVNVDEIVATAIARLQARTGARRIRFESDGAARWILADPVALEQALMNLLDNAAKYSPPERAIVVRLETRGRHFTVLVIDEGVGIPSADLPHVGERFFRGSNNGSTRTGFGLGLAIVRQIVENHGGRLEVSSVPHEGTTVLLELPRIKEA